MRCLSAFLLYFNFNLNAAWTTITFFGDSVHTRKDPNNENETITEEVPRLLVRAWYPWDAMSGAAYYISLVYQVCIIT